MTNGTVRLDKRQHAFVLRGDTRVLQEKAWQVAEMLADNYPETVSRDQIIDKIWNGNLPVGEKGLNQAIWQLRSASEDSARAPHVIRTVPRVGYQWMQPPTNRTVTRLHGWFVGNYVRLAGIGCALALALGTLFIAQTAEAPYSLGTARNPATDAYIVGRDIHLVFEDGTKGILINENHADILSPVLSIDGSEVAIAVREDGRCRMVTINLATREREDFSDCPVA